MQLQYFCDQYHVVVEEEYDDALNQAESVGSCAN